MIGINLAGAEFGAVPGAYGFDYIYPNARELDPFKSEGIDLIRLPFRWERVQPTLGEPLDAAEVGRIQTFLDEAEARDMHVVLDVHNFGRYRGQVIGSEAVPISTFADFWSKMATQFGGVESVAGFGLMNEPHDMGGREVWPAAAQAATNAIRATGATENIVVGGDGWSSAGMWQFVNGSLAVNDPLNKIVYEAHIYFDRDNSGSYKGTFDEEGVPLDIGVRRLNTFQQWLAANDAKGFIGEFGVPADDPRWLEALSQFVDALHEYGIDGTAWAAGPWWGNYKLSLEPVNGEDKPQLDILTRYESDAPAAALINDTVAENDSGGLIGDIALTDSRDVLAPDANNADVTFSVSDKRFEVISDSEGHHLKLADDASLDFETEPQVPLSITTNSASGRTNTQNVVVRVEDVPGNTIVGSPGNDIIDATHSAPNQPFATAENDTIFGMEGSDTIAGGVAPDQIDGGSGIDTASYASSATGVSVSLRSGTGQGGDAEGDTLVSIENLTGSAFHDRLEGNAGANRLDGGLGSDTITYENSAAGVTVNLVSKVAQVSAGDANGDVLLNIEHVVGSSFDDSLTGDSLANMLTGGPGSDSLNGGSGADTLLGGSGDDVYTVDSTADLVMENAGEGADTVRTSLNYALPANVENLTLLGTGNINGTGNEQDNLLVGSGGKNILSGLDGNDTLAGGDGDDMLTGGAGQDRLDGGNGVDTASYAASSERVEISLLTGTPGGGEAEGDTLVSIENVTGSAFDDLFEGNGTANRFDGGAGIDTVTYERSSAGVSVDLTSTKPQLSTGDASGDSLVSIENVVGSAFDDTLTGNASANVLAGGDGADTLNGAGGADTMLGGRGNDIYFVDHAGDVVTEQPGEGADTVRAMMSSGLDENIENLTLLGAGNYNGTGNAADNVLTGNAGSNTLSGMEGNDTLIGGAARDTLTGGSGNDTFVFAVGFGRDTVTDFSAEGDVLQFDMSVFADFGQALQASTQAGADVVIAYDADNSVTLQGVNLSSLQAEDFLFV